MATALFRGLVMPRVSTRPNPMEMIKPATMAVVMKIMDDLAFFSASETSCEAACFWPRTMSSIAAKAFCCTSLPDSKAM